MICSGCNQLKPIENRDMCLCATCNKARREAETTDLYPEVRKMFLTMCIKIGAKCPITDEDITMDSDIHHKKGRTGYADDWARANDVPLLIDPRYFLACSRSGHMFIEANRKWAEDRGYTLSRLEKI